MLASTRNKVFYSQSNLPIFLNKSSLFLTLIALVTSILILIIISKFIKRLSVKLPIYLTLIFLVYCFKSSELIISPLRLKNPYTPERVNMQYSDVQFFTEDSVEIIGWYIEGRGDKTVILCHPYGMDRAYCIPHAIFLNKMGYDILLFDFRGHGNSGGKYCSLGYYETADLLAGISFLKRMGKDNIGVLGFSMGGTTALIAASLSPDIDAVIAEGAYVSFHSATYYYAKRYLHAPRYPFLPPAIWSAGIRLGFNPKRLDLENFCHDIKDTPVMVIHSKGDTEIPVTEGLEIYRLLGEPKYKWILEDAEHLLYHLREGKRYEEKVGEFFDRFL